MRNTCTHLFGKIPELQNMLNFKESSPATRAVFKSLSAAQSRPAVGLGRRQGQGFQPSPMSKGLITIISYLNIQEKE